MKKIMSLYLVFIGLTGFLYVRNALLEEWR